MGDGSVLKAYRRQRHTSRPVEDWRDHEVLTRGFFEAEAVAYERLAQNAGLAVFTPKFMGRADPCQFPDLTEPPQEGYVKDCALRLERIAGKDVKVSLLRQPIRGEVETVLKRLRDDIEAGHVWDASCFVPGSRARFTLIDFATWDGFTDLQILLEERGRFTDEERAGFRWGTL